MKSHSTQLHACRSSEQDCSIWEVGDHAKSHLTGEAQANTLHLCTDMSPGRYLVVNRIPQHKHDCPVTPA